MILVIPQSVERFGEFPSRHKIFQSIELAARVCYKSEPLPVRAYEKRADFIRSLIKKGHESVIEHVSFSYEIVTDRGVMAELTRHRLASFSVESTRYCRYDKDDAFKVISPFDDDSSEEYRRWLSLMEETERVYNELVKRAPPEIARSVLPQCFATRIRITANAREWRHILRLRTSRAAHPQIRWIAEEILKDLAKEYPPLFSCLNITLRV
jgi:thymidylate synthase (FAD)